MGTPRGFSLSGFQGGYAGMPGMGLMQGQPGIGMGMGVPGMGIPGMPMPMGMGGVGPMRNHGGGRMNGFGGGGARMAAANNPYARNDARGGRGMMSELTLPFRSRPSADQ